MDPTHAARAKHGIADSLGAGLLRGRAGRRAIAVAPAERSPSELTCKPSPTRELSLSIRRSCFSQPWANDSTCCRWALRVSRPQRAKVVHRRPHTGALTWRRSPDWLPRATSPARFWASAASSTIATRRPCPASAGPLACERTVPPHGARHDELFRALQPRVASGRRRRARRGPTWSGARGGSAKPRRSEVRFRGRHPKACAAGPGRIRPTRGSTKSDRTEAAASSASSRRPAPSTAPAAARSGQVRRTRGAPCAPPQYVSRATHSRINESTTT